MSRANRIIERLTESLEPAHLQLTDESHGHSVPKGAETHFNLILVSSAFAGKSRVQRQRQVYAALSSEIQQGLHALTMRTLTPEEWEKAGGEITHESPRCFGGMKKKAQPG